MTGVVGGVFGYANLPTISRDLSSAPLLLDFIAVGSFASPIMSDLSEVLNHAHPRKPAPGISAREVSKTYSLDGIDGIDEQDVDDSYHGHLGVTRNDQKDMTRMGKIQQLRVSRRWTHTSIEIQLTIS